MRGWICLAVFARLFLATPASAEWNEQTLLESDTYMQVFGVSDDGSKIVYIADTDGNDVTTWDRDVFLMDLNTGEVTRITRNLDREWVAGISGDGNVIVYGTITRAGGRNVIKYYEVRGDEGWQTPRPLMHGVYEFMGS